MKTNTILFLLVILFAGGCASPAYRQVLKEEPKYNARDFSSAKRFMCQAVSRAILSKNFLVEKEEADSGYIVGRRSFQRGRRTDVVLVQAKIMPVTADRCTVYLNGVESSNVKPGEKIISDKRFYEAFFSCINAELNYVLAAVPPSDVTVAFEKLAQDVQIPAEQGQEQAR